MKTYSIILTIGLLAFCFTSCDENEELPDFLDGTEFGILLNVDVTSGETILLNEINTTSVSFDVTYEDSKRPVQSIVVQKTFVDADGNISDNVEQMTVTSSPSSANLSVSDLVTGISGLSIDDIEEGDLFRIEFIINYADGAVVDRYGTGVNPNFDVVFSGG